MGITDFLVASDNLAFLISGCLLVSLLILEAGALLLFGGSIGHHGDFDTVGDAGDFSKEAGSWPARSI